MPTKKHNSDPHGAAARIRHSKLNEAVRKVGNLAALEALLPPEPKPDITDVLHDSMGVRNRADAPEPGPRPLLPNRWWDHAGAAMEPENRQPIIVVSHQVAEVLNMGIDRVVDVAARTKDNLEVAQNGLEHYRREYEWLREFMRNVRDRIGSVRDGESIIPEGGPQHFLEDLARSIDLLEKGLPV